jgi:aminoglycoside phosphotransferase (APT) family kinase protein
VFALHEPKVIGVLDWELSTLGDPLADAAYRCEQSQHDSERVGAGVRESRSFPMAATSTQHRCVGLAGCSAV